MGVVEDSLRRLNEMLGAKAGYQVAKVRRAPAKTDSKAVSGQKAKPHAEVRPAKVRYRAPSDPSVDRLLRRPIFIMSPPRSGSTLLRVILGRHSKLHSQHETHFRRLEVSHGTKLGRYAMRELDLGVGDLQHLLWDRVLHWSMVKAGKERVVEKTPSNVFAWRRISTCWPDAQYIFLLRHPASIARSWQLKSPAGRNAEEAAINALSYMEATEQARNALPGYTIRYEDLTDDAESVVKDICTFLEIDFESDMLEYGPDAVSPDHSRFGDDTEKIRSGRVQPARELPTSSEVPESLEDICRTWGYQ